MTEERITETRTPDGNTHTHTTVISDGEHVRGGGSGKWLILLTVLVLGAVGLYFFSQSNSAEVARDNAIAEAAGDVGDAAGQIGDAAKDAADNIGN